MDYTFSNIVEYGFFGVLFDEVKNGIAFYVLSLLICAVIAYLIGSISFAVIISRLKFKDDIRNHGSGNAGTTNMMRSFGKAAAAFTLFGDIMKAVVSVYIGIILNGTVGGYIAGLLCIIGHAFPVYFKFKGGKSVASSAGVILCLNPVVFVTLLLIFIVIVSFTKYVSLGSIMCMMVYPLILYRLNADHNIVILTVSILIAALVIFLHRENIVRLKDGKENKFSFHLNDKNKTASKKEK
jgi:glycerol-3-phosphate acyltransferase PlsY